MLRLLVSQVDASTCDSLFGNQKTDMSTFYECRNRIYSNQDFLQLVWTAVKFTGVRGIKEGSGCGKKVERSSFFSEPFILLQLSCPDS